MTTIPSADLNRAIAQLLGVKPRLRGYYVCSPDGKSIVLESAWKGECEKWLAERKAKGQLYADWHVTEGLVWPDYTGSLDDVAQAEKWAIDHDYGPLLNEALDGNCFASARARAEALYAVLGRREGGA